MVVSVRLSASITSLLASLALATSACGGDDPVVVLDAPIADAATDAPIDAIPACGAGEMRCAGECVNTTNDEDFCGSCTNACTGGQACTQSACACPANFVPASPQFIQEMMINQAGFSAGAGGMIGSAINALVVGLPTAFPAAIDTSYTLDGMANKPFVAAGYDLDMSTFTPSSSFAATAGTLRFTRVCRDANNNVTGIGGTITGATFSAVEDLMNPTPIPNGCTFVAPATITFTYGVSPCPAS